MSLRDDYVIRLIRQFVDALARMVGYRKSGDYERALAEAGRVWDELGVPRELVTATDGATLASLLREPEKLRVAAQLLAEEAHVMQAKGDPLNAGELRARAIELLARAREHDPRSDDDDAIHEIGRLLPASVFADAMARAEQGRPKT